MITWRSFYKGDNLIILKKLDFTTLPDVTLSDENASVMNRFSKSQFENLSLKTTFEEIFDGKTQDVIQLHL